MKLMIDQYHAYKHGLNINMAHRNALLYRYNKHNEEKVRFFLHVDAWEYNETPPMLGFDKRSFFFGIKKKCNVIKFRK